MTAKKDIPFGSPSLSAAEVDAVAQVLSGTRLVHGPVTHEFERRFAERMGVRHAVSVSSCTAALYLSLFARGVGAGDEVVVPAMTHVATAHSVEMCGAKPVFADVSVETGNVDPAAIAEVLSDSTAALMPVHYLGLPCEMEPIHSHASRCGAFVVEDCALAVDATYDGVKAGGLGLAGCFSFYPVKHMTTIEGGMLTTNNDQLAAAVMQRRAFGYDRPLGERAEPGIYDVTELGANYRMNEVEAAVGLAQLDKLDGFQAARKGNFAELRGQLADIEEITVFPTEHGKARSSHYCLNAVLPRDRSIVRSDVASHLREVGIGYSVHYPEAVPHFTYYREKYGYRKGQYPIAEWLAAQTISLPVGPHLEDGDCSRIANALKDAIVKARTAVGDRPATRSH